MPKINLYTDETAPLYQLVNKKLCKDLFNSIHSYIRPTIYAFRKEIKWVLYYDDLELLSML